MQTFSDDIEAGGGADGLEEERALGIGGTEEKEPVPVQGPLKSVMRPPDEKVGEGPFRGLRLVFPNDLPQDLPIFELQGFKLGEFRDHEVGDLLKGRLLVTGCSLLVASYSFLVTTISAWLPSPS
jgi:hypothetical protein